MQKMIASDFVHQLWESVMHVLAAKDSAMHTAILEQHFATDWTKQIERLPEPELTDLDGLCLLDVGPSGAALGLGALPGHDLDVDEGVAGLRDVVHAVVQLRHDAVEARAYRHRGLVRLDLEHRTV